MNQAIRFTLSVFLLWLSGQTLADLSNMAEPDSALLAVRADLQTLLSQMEEHPDLYRRPADRVLLLNLSQRRQALDIWQRYYQHLESLLDLASAQKKGYLFANNKSERSDLYSAALIAYYRFGLEWVERAENDRELVTLYNEAQTEPRLNKNSYKRLRKHLLSDWMTDRYDDLVGNGIKINNLLLAVAASEEKHRIEQLSRSELIWQGAADSVGRTLYSAYYPVQKGVARGMGKIKVWRIGKTLITPEQALQFSRELEPGDYFLTRKEWRLTNAGIPGFWTHSALYIGTPEERAAYFDTPEIRHWLESLGIESFDALLREVSPAYELHPGYDRLGDIRVIEALDAGVIFNSIETSLDADGAAVFRPRLSKLEKAKAIYNAFHYTGAPYDFHFDFDSDSALVCSELIFKAYQQSDDQRGIQFPLNRVVGRKMVTPSEMAQWYEQTLGTDQQQVDLALFIDANEKAGVAFKSTHEAFIGSWQRPDWYIFQQPPMAPDQLAKN